MTLVTEATKIKIFLCVRRCLGSTQHLKNLYGAGYTLEVKLKHIENIVKSTSISSPNGAGGGVGFDTTAGGGNVNTADQQLTSFDICAEQEERSAMLRSFVAELFPDATLEESFADRLVYSLPQNAVSSLAQCFSQLERGLFV